MPMTNYHAAGAMDDDDNKTRFKALVVDNNDPDKTHRVKIRVRGLHTEWDAAHLPWAALAGSTGGHPGFGSIRLPRKGEFVWVVFDDSNGNAPVIVGSVNTEDTRTTELEEGYPDAIGHIDHNNNKTFTRADGSTYFHHNKGTIIEIDANSNVKVISAGTVTFESQGVMKFIAGGNIELHSGATVKVRYVSEFNADIGGAETPTATTERDPIEIDEDDKPNF